jgi:hypothetical protein
MMVNSAQMRKSSLMREMADAAGYEVVDIRLPESLQFSDVRGFPRVDVKALVEQARRRQAMDSLISASEE